MTNKLNAAESSRYKLVEDVLRNSFSNVQCMWEVAKPAGTNIAMLAGFLIVYKHAARLVIVQVFEDGRGYEIYAAPSTNTTSGTIDSLTSMWSA
jgi:hypothetical protein